MSRTILKWKLMHLVRLIVATVLNKYDFFIVIEGGTGIGKSTLAYHLAKQIAREFKRLFKLKEDFVEYYYNRIAQGLKMTEEEFVEKIMGLKEINAYHFNPREALIYTQDELQNALASWHTVSIPDEMINITFNRDFYSEKQKDIIKMLNMFRDHGNITIACVPQFQNLDTQIKNLCKMKITVKKRGLAIIHTPNPVIYSKDKWDQATNEKIERDWIKRKVMRPNYSKLTTFRGLVKFPPLTKDQEARYQRIKNEKRTVVLRDDMGIRTKDDNNPFNDFMERLLNGAIRSGHVVDGYAHGMGMKVDAFRNKVARELERRKLNTALSFYYKGARKSKIREEEKENEFKGI